MHRKLKERSCHSYSVLHYKSAFGPDSMEDTVKWRAIGITSTAITCSKLMFKVIEVSYLDLVKTHGIYR